MFLSHSTEPPPEAAEQTGASLQLQAVKPCDCHGHRRMQIQLPQAHHSSHCRFQGLTGKLCPTGKPSSMLRSWRGFGLYSHESHHLPEKHGKTSPVPRHILRVRATCTPAAPAQPACTRKRDQEAPQEKTTAPSMPVHPYPLQGMQLREWLQRAGACPRAEQCSLPYFQPHHPSPPHPRSAQWQRNQSFQSHVKVLAPFIEKNLCLPVTSKK